MIDSMTTLAALVPAVAAMAAVYLSCLAWSNSALVYGKVTVTDTKKVVFFGTAEITTEVSHLKSLGIRTVSMI